jgi:hypothetical protein
MHADYQVPKDPWENPGRRVKVWDNDEWERWDDGLVEDFNRWLTRISKGLVILFCMALAGVITLWIWSAF